ncbi:hypothetical protein [Melissococcus sp. OM08-11BH]|uniref:hypothetical protein n=1 Tax=Melissococcus sp. OM08-11BH TaxID=2293110 RepID=UPI000E48627B|nr:hypothetical protein [Melissococcus sp. OM08-11BH]RGI30855.1 hypothetical protein DXC12_04460 [Melissococcus sp. OM08-11BH]
MAIEKLNYNVDKIKMPSSTKLDKAFQELETVVFDTDSLKQELIKKISSEPVKKPTALSDLKALIKKPTDSKLSEAEVGERMAVLNQYLQDNAPDLVATVKQEYYSYKKAVNDIWDQYVKHLCIANSVSSEQVATHLRLSVNAYTWKMRQIEEILNKDFDAYTDINCFLVESKIGIDIAEVETAIYGATF